MKTYLIIHFICWLLVVAISAFGLGSNKIGMKEFYNIIIPAVFVAPFMIFISPFYVLGQKFKT